MAMVGLAEGVQPDVPKDRYLADLAADNPEGLPVGFTWVQRQRIGMRMPAVTVYAALTQMQLQARVDLVELGMVPAGPPTATCGPCVESGTQHWLVVLYTPAEVDCGC